ncbi:MAG: protein kinase domain-containing protein, partial [Thermoanaerobaculia bacterium]
MAGALGDGAVGLVRKATRESDKQMVAVKLLAPDPKYIEESSFDDVAARFKREGERGVKLRHPHLIAIKAYSDNLNAQVFEGTGPTNPLLIMEFLRGKTLESFIRNLDDEEAGRFQITQTKLNIAVQITSAIESLHNSKL